MIIRARPVFFFMRMDADTYMDVINCKLCRLPSTDRAVILYLSRDHQAGRIFKGRIGLGAAGLIGISRAFGAVSIYSYVGIRTFG